MQLRFAAAALIGGLLSLFVTPALAQDEGLSDARSLQDTARGLAALVQSDADEIIRIGEDAEAPRLVAVVPGKDGALLRFATGDESLFLAEAALFELPAPAKLGSRLRRLARAWKGEETPELRHQPLLGWVLRAGDRILDEKGRVWTETQGESALRIESLVAAAEGAKARLAATELSPLAKKAVAHILDQVHLSAAPSEDEHVTPDLARRMIRTGVLGRALDEGSREVLDTLTVELERATAPRGQRTWTNGTPPAESLTISFTEDGFGPRGIVMREGGTLRARLHRMPKPSFAPGRNELWTRLDYDESGAVGSAEVWAKARRLGTWVPGDELSADELQWRRVFPEDTASTFTRIAEGFMPPHLVALDPEGTILFLATATGTVRPPRDGAPEERERFVKEAAAALPDVAHLDLVGQYFFAYVHDSPDPTLPWLVGHEGAIGEIHQSVEQTLGTAAGGVCRGDCDDLAEVYQALTRAQGKISHIMAVPGHNALAWADQDPDTERWTVRVLHTGPPLEFRSRRLERALGYAYKHFGAFENFDPDQCLVAVRFSGENTRSTWALGWRIFRDAPYAETMIDVQRDWHFHTFSRGIAKMEALIASGDDDVANYREMSGLSERIGRFDDAVVWLERALERSKDDRLTLMSRMASDLYAADRDEEAAKIVARAVERLDKIGDRRGATRIALAFELAQIVYAAEDARPFLPVVSGHLTDSVGNQILGLAQLLEDGRIDDEAWRREPQIAEIRRIARNYAGIGTQILESADAGLRQENPALARIASQLEVYTSVLAFRDPDTESLGAAPVFAEIGQLARASLGAEIFDPMLEAAELPPADAKPRVRGRAASQLQLAMDLPWIKASPAYWSRQIFQLFRRDVTALDRARFAALRKHYEAAVAADRFSEMKTTRLDDAILGRTAFLFALVDGDESAIRAHFAHVARQNDKNLRDDTVDLLGATAKFVSDDTWTTALALWDELIGKKATYFAIAWEAMSARAPERALAAGRLAARRFSDDPAFAEELKLLAAQVEGGTTEKADGR